MTLTASLIGAADPQLVQIIESATTSGQAWTITGAAGGVTWTVPGGSGVGDGNQLNLVDNRAPLNTPVVYTYTSGATVETSGAVVRASTSDIVLQTPDGQKVVGGTLQAGSDELELSVRAALFEVPNRRRPVVRHGTTGAGGGSIVVRVPYAKSPAFDDLLAAGSTLIWLMGVTYGLPLDMPLVSAFIVTRASSKGIPTIGVREWALEYRYVDDPYLDTRLGAFPWSVFDSSMSTKTWAQFDTLFSSKTWNQFDTTQWNTL